MVLQRSVKPVTASLVINWQLSGLGPLWAGAGSGGRNPVLDSCSVVCCLSGSDLASLSLSVLLWKTGLAVLVPLNEIKMARLLSLCLSQSWCTINYNFSSITVTIGVYSLGDMTAPNQCILFFSQKEKGLISRRLRRRRLKISVSCVLALPSSLSCVP